MGKEFTYR
uniref:Uncharacterized protein n=1 Tax=Rhizophora mucronata TaxID=61149 RepID=A0A2P2J1H2_RHIMU